MHFNSNPLSKHLFTLLLLVIIGSVSHSLSAQDVIYKKDGKILRVKVVEIGDTKIKYTEFTDQDGIVFTMPRSAIREIELESGNIYEERDPGEDMAFFYDDHRSNLKVNFLRLGQGDLLFTYEQAVNPNQSWEVMFKLFLDDQPTNNFGGGVGVQGGYKLKTGTIFKGGDYRPKHLLAGGYIRPGAGFTTRTRRFDPNASILHFGIDLGYQWVFSNVLSLDLFVGFHYFALFEGERDTRPDFYSFNDFDAGNLYGADGSAGAFGLRVGYLFNSEADRQGVKRSRKKRRNVIN